MPWVSHTLRHIKGRGVCRARIELLCRGGAHEGPVHVLRGEGRRVAQEQLGHHHGVRQHAALRFVLLQRGGATNAGVCSKVHHGIRLARGAADLNGDAVLWAVVAQDNKGSANNAVLAKQRQVGVCEVAVKVRLIRAEEREARGNVANGARRCIVLLLRARPQLLRVKQAAHVVAAVCRGRRVCQPGVDAVLLQCSPDPAQVEVHVRHGPGLALPERDAARDAARAEDGHSLHSTRAGRLCRWQLAAGRPEREPELAVAGVGKGKAGQVRILEQVQHLCARAVQHRRVIELLHAAACGGALCERRQRVCTCTCTCVVDCGPRRGEPRKQVVCLQVLGGILRLGKVWPGRPDVIALAELHSLCGASVNGLPLRAAVAAARQQLAASSCELFGGWGLLVHEVAHAPAAVLPVGDVLGHVDCEAATERVDSWPVVGGRQVDCDAGLVRHHAVGCHHFEDDDARLADKRGSVRDEGDIADGAIPRAAGGRALEHQLARLDAEAVEREGGGLCDGGGQGQALVEAIWAGGDAHAQLRQRQPAGHKHIGVVCELEQALALSICHHVVGAGAVAVEIQERRGVLLARGDVDAGGGARHAI